MQAVPSPGSLLQIRFAFHSYILEREVRGDTSSRRALSVFLSRPLCCFEATLGGQREGGLEFRCKRPRTDSLEPGNLGHGTASRCRSSGRAPDASKPGQSRPAQRLARVANAAGSSRCENAASSFGPSVNGSSNSRMRPTVSASRRASSGRLTICRALARR